MRFIVFIFFILLATSALAQMEGNVISIGWNTVKPLSNEDFVSKTSSSGLRVGFSKIVNERFGYGLEGGFNTLNDYVPRQTYEYPGGAITTDIYNYLNYYTLMASGQYYIVQTKNFIPYAGLAMGVAFTEYRQYYNVYNDSDAKTGFAIRPEIGTLIRINEDSRWGLKAAASYDYAANKSKYFETDNFAGISFQLGLVLFSN